MSALNYLKHPIITARYLGKVIPAYLKFELNREWYNQTKNPEHTENLFEQLDIMDSAVKVHMTKLFPEEVDPSLSKLRSIRGRLEERLRARGDLVL